MEDVKNVLTALAEKLHAAKLAEETAKDNRITLEAQVSALIPTDGTKQKTVTLSNGYKLTVKRPVSYKADILGIEKELIFDTGLPMPIESKTTRSLDVKGYEWYREHKPDVFARLAGYVTVKPLKTSVKLDLPKEK